jgi:hypothetical protein
MMRGQSGAAARRSPLLSPRQRCHRSVWSYGPVMHGAPLGNGAVTGGGMHVSGCAADSVAGKRQRETAGIALSPGCHPGVKLGRISDTARQI